MGNGFEGLLFVLLLVFWVMEAIASARKKRQQGKGPFPGEIPDGLPPAQGPADIRPVDRADERGARFPERATPRERSVLPERGGRETPAPRGGARPEAVSSEEELTAVPEGERAVGMLPRDLWEELAALARGEAPVRRPAEPPAPAVPAPRSPPETDRAREARNRATRKRDGHGLESRRREQPRAAPARVVVGSDEAMAARERHTPAAVMAAEEVLPERPPPGSDAFRAVFGGTTTADLRRAVVLREVLGPPLSLRPPPGADH
jgi:hypothetical protein